MFVPNHLHFIARAHVERPPTSEKELNNWLTELVALIEMNVVAGPTSVYVSEPGNEGVTGTITLATSHASVHVWDAERPSLVQFDIYSCKAFSYETVLGHLDQFGLIDAQYIMIDRNVGIDVLFSGTRGNK